MTTKTTSRRQTAIENTINEINMLLIATGIPTTFLGVAVTPDWEDTKYWIDVNIKVLDELYNMTDDQYADKEAKTRDN